MKSSELLRKLLRAGWVIQPDRGKGSHFVLRHPNHKDPIILPSHGSSEVGMGLAHKILKQAGLK